VLRELSEHSDVDLRLIAMGPHLSPEFGSTVREIEFTIDSRIECLLSSDTDVGMAKTIGVAVLGLADCLDRMRPDLLLVIADRYEMLAPASVALALRIPLAHIEGGEVSEGAIDDAVRNALTKLSHVHFTSTEKARSRVIAMGEEPWRVHCAGAPSLDHLRRGVLLTREEVERRLEIHLSVPPALVAFHPTTIARDTNREAGALYDALAAMEGPLVFCYPNADAGSRELMERARAFGRGRVFVNLEPVLYWSLLRCCEMTIGNSSSGVMEAASFGIPAIDVGLRQYGRERGINVLSAPADAMAILACIAQARGAAFRRSLVGMANPYGEGHAAERIAQVLSTVPLGEQLLRKAGSPANRTCVAGQ
jgi:UDP-N-acetylglucosamine 2-epimerase (non-hydrolysing)/GDP/UDP-N,N'-diacetylbacillosamine 2-epimerase (hydrolysing)